MDTVFFATVITIGIVAAFVYGFYRLARLLM